MKIIRNNITSACISCQQKKIKCTEERPCEQCLKRNIVCEPSDKKKKRGPVPRSKKELLKIDSLLNHDK